MIRVFILIFVFTFPHLDVSAIEITELRKLYYRATVEKEASEEFIRVMEGMESNKVALLLCYKGMAHLIRANHAFNPYTKFSSFVKGRDMLEMAIQADPLNVEIHFMRFCVQSNAPFFLGYSNHIEEDKWFVLDNWGPIADRDLKAKIRTYLLSSESCTTSEKLLLK